MSLVNGPYRFGTLLILVSAMLHILTFVAGGFASEMMAFLPLGLVFGLIAFGLSRGWRWLAYVAFLAAMIGAVFVLSYLWTPIAAPQWTLISIIAVNCLAAAALFAALWRPAPVLQAAD